jgi:hypothetical protein
MTGDTFADLIKPLVGQAGSISIVVRGSGEVTFAMSQDKKLTGVQVRPDGLVLLERETGWAAIDPAEVVAVAWRSEADGTPGQFL